MTAAIAAAAGAAKDALSRRRRPSPALRPLLDRFHPALVGPGVSAPRPPQPPEPMGPRPPDDNPAGDLLIPEAMPAGPAFDRERQRRRTAAAAA